MNFLAHTFLSEEKPGLIVGNYLGDFLRNKEVNKLPAAIKHGVFLHRAIDSFTDVDARVKSGTSLLHESMGKYAPVVLDIYFDYLLSKRWNEFHHKSLEDYCQQTYRILLRHQHIMSERLANRMQRMIMDRWLENYQSYPGLQRVFGFLARRVKFDSNLSDATSILADLEEPLEEIFMTFFPDLINHSKETIADLQSKMEKEN